jgi:hypothetical protein
MILILCVIPLCLWAQDNHYSSLPGNAGFDKIKNLKYFGKVTKINLDENIFNMIDYENTQGGAELRKLLKPLKMIMLYTIDDIKKIKADSLKIIYSEIDSSLNVRGWKKFITTEEDNGITNIYVMYSGEQKIIGLAITSLKESGSRYKGNLINIAGDIDMNTIGKVGRKFKLPALSKDEDDDE